MKNITIIPAHPGFFAGEITEGGDGKKYMTWEPVIAWAVEPTADDSGEYQWSDPHPVTPEWSTHAGHWPIALKYPDGRILVANDRWFSDEDGVVEYLLSLEKQ